MSSYTKLQPPSQPKSITNTAENRYWNKFNLIQPCPIKHITGIQQISYSPNDSNTFAVCSSTRVQFYHESNNSLQQTSQISRFKSPVHTCVYRSDSKLMACGIDTGDIQLYDVNSRNMLRQLKSHTAAVYSTIFKDDDTAYLYSGSDDSTVKLWNIQTEQQLSNYTSQTDYVRHIVQHPTMPNIIYTGSYDHTIAMYDTRIDHTGSNKPIQLLQHGSPVECMLMMSSGTLLLGAGENYINIYDLLNNGKCIHTLSNHTKTITSLCMDGSNTRLLSGGLDQHVKIYDTTSYNVTHTLTYQQPILSMSLNSNNTLLSIGTVSGELLVSQRQLKHAAQPKQYHAMSMMRGNTKRYYNRGANSTPNDHDIIIPKHRSIRYTEYDNYLRKFQYNAALNTALNTKRVNLIYSVFNELIDRNGLIIALSNRDESTLAPILEYIINNINNVLYTTLLVDISHIILDIYTVALGQSPAIDQLIMSLKSAVLQQTELMKSMYTIQGQLDIYLTHTKSIAQSTVELLNNNNNNTTTDSALQLETQMLFDDNVMLDVNDDEQQHKPRSELDHESANSSDKDESVTLVKRINKSVATQSPKLISAKPKRSKR